MPETLRAIPEETRTPRDTNAEAKEARRHVFLRLVPDIASGDRKAWSELIRMTESIVRQEVGRILKSSQEVPDTVQTILEDLISKKINLPQFDPVSGDYEAWIKQVARNYCMRYFRKAKTDASRIGRTERGQDREHVGVEELAEATAGGENEIIKHIEDTIGREKIEEILETLRKKNKVWAQIFELRYLEGKQTTQIADEMGMPATTVRTILSRSRELVLRKHVIDMLEVFPTQFPKAA